MKVEKKTNFFFLHFKTTLVENNFDDPMILFDRIEKNSNPFEFHSIHFLWFSRWVWCKDWFDLYFCQSIFEHRPMINDRSLNRWSKTENKVRRFIFFSWIFSIERNTKIHLNYFISLMKICQCFIVHRRNFFNKILTRKNNTKFFFGTHFIHNTFDWHRSVEHFSLRWNSSLNSLKKKNFFSTEIFMTMKIFTIWI